MVPATVDLTSIIENGTAALKDVWQHPPIDQVVEAIENQYITIGPNSTVELSNINQEQTWELTIDNSGPSQLLVNYDIKYKTVNDGDWVDVNSINVNAGSRSWSARTLLAINLGPDISQRLLQNQSVTLHYSDDTTQTINGSAPYIRNIATGNTGDTTYATLSIPYYPIVLESFNTIYFDGGGSYNVTQILDNDEIEYNSIYQYQEQVTSSDKIYRVTTSGDIILTFKPGVNNLKIPYIVPQGNYMFRIINASLELTNLTVEDEDSETLLGAIYDSSITDFANIPNAILQLVVD